MRRPFSRKQKTSNEAVPTEIKQYYTEEARDRKGATWLTGAIVFVATVAVVLGLFYGGRALYRALFADETPTAPTAQQENNAGNRDANGFELGPQDNNTNNDNQTDTPNDTPTGDSEVTDEELPQNDSEESETTPNTGGGEAEEIPRTGPDRFF